MARRCRVNPHNIHGYVLGEHGDTSFPAWSLLTIGGINIDEFCPTCGLCDDLDAFNREQDLMRSLVANSALPCLTLDVSDNNIPGAVERIADWLEDSGGLYMP